MRATRGTHDDRGDTPPAPLVSPLPAATANRRDEAPPERRTVTITGRGDARYYPPVPRRGGPAPVRYSYGPASLKPDRVAMWAVLLCVVLLLVAATSSHAASFAAHAATLHAHI